MAACIETENLNVDIDHKPLWDQGLTVRIERGRRVRLAGPSGCGKSTLLKCLMGFMPTFSGVIRIDQEELTAASVWKLRQKLVYLAQEPDLGTGSVSARLREPFGYRHNAQIKFDTDKLHHWLAYYHLPRTILDKDLKMLSGGEKQRLAVISAILLNRRVFLLDEPVSAMDALSRRQFIEMFRSHPDWTAVFISHDESLSEMADETIDLAEMRQGVQRQ